MAPKRTGSTMAKKKGAVMAIKLLSTAGTGFFYATKKNVKNVPKKLQLMKVRACVFGMVDGCVVLLWFGALCGFGDLVIW